MIRVSGLRVVGIDATRKGSSKALRGWGRLAPRARLGVPRGVHVGKALEQARVASGDREQAEATARVWVGGHGGPPGRPARAGTGNKQGVGCEVGTNSSASLYLGCHDAS